MELKDCEVRHHGNFTERDLPKLLGENGNVPLIEKYLAENGSGYREAFVVMWDVFQHKSCFACKHFSWDQTIKALCHHPAFPEPKKIINTVKLQEGCKMFKGVEK